jgi:hypothetical protein
VECDVKYNVEYDVKYDVDVKYERGKDPSNEGRLNVIKNSQRDQSTASKSSRKQISKKNSEKMYSPNKLSKTKVAASVNKELRDAQRILPLNSSSRQRRKLTLKDPY